MTEDKQNGSASKNMPDDKQAAIDERIRLFGELLSCQGVYYIWSYSADGNLLSTNCSYLYLDTVLKRSSSYKELLEYAEHNTMPIIISATFGLIWGVVIEREENGLLSRFHVLGPAFTQMPERSEMEAVLRSTDSATRKWAPKLIRRLESLPVVTFSNFCQRIMMLHYCVYEQHIQLSDITLVTGVIDVLRGRAYDPDTMPDILFPEELPDRSNAYRAEYSLLQMIRDGNLQYKESLQSVASAFNGKQQLAGNALQHAKLSQVIIITLASRAAIEGGVSPEVAYPLQDAFIRDVENAGSAAEITDIGRSMLEEFVQLVHRKNSNTGISREIQSCCDYIDANPGEKITIAYLAGRVGYTDYYLSRKFKGETGVSVHDYIKKARIKRAQQLLKTTDLSIQDISDMLGFGARSFFAEVFRQMTGVPPAKWRDEHKVI